MQERDNTDPNLFASLSEFQAAQSQAPGRLRRRPTPEQGAALECLGHALEYLIDESLLSAGSLNPDVTEAVQILSAASREVYLSCTESSRDSRGRAGRGSLVLWKWLPSSSSLLPIFRNRENGR